MQAHTISKLAYFKLRTENEFVIYYFSYSITYKDTASLKFLFRLVDVFLIDQPKKYKSKEVNPSNFLDLLQISILYLHHGV